MNVSAQRFTTKARTWLFIDRAQSVPVDVNPATASLYIVNPLRRQGVATLFSTHPPIAERVRRLRALDGDQTLQLVA